MLKKKPKFLFQLFTEMSTTERISSVFAGLAFIVSIGTLYYTEKQIEYETRPVIYIGTEDSQSPIGYYGLILRNNGIGPAKIEKISIYFDGKLIDPNDVVGDIITRNISPERPLDYDISASNIEKGLVIGSCQERNIYCARKADLHGLSKFDTNLKRISTDIEYSSISNKVYSVKYPLEK